MCRDGVFGFLFGAFILLATFLVFLVSGLAVPHRVLFLFVLAALMDLGVVFVSVALGYHALYLVGRFRPGFLSGLPEYIRAFGLGLAVVYVLTGLYVLSSFLAVFALTLFILAGSLACARDVSGAPQKKAGKRKSRRQVLFGPVD